MYRNVCFRCRQSTIDNENSAKVDESNGIHRSQTASSNGQSAESLESNLVAYTDLIRQSFPFLDSSHVNKLCSIKQIFQKKHELHQSASSTIFKNKRALGIPDHLKNEFVDAIRVHLKSGALDADNFNGLPMKRSYSETLIDGPEYSLSSKVIRTSDSSALVGSDRLASDVESSSCTLSDSYSETDIDSGGVLGFEINLHSFEGEIDDDDVAYEEGNLSVDGGSGLRVINQTTGPSNSESTGLPSENKYKQKKGSNNISKKEAKDREKQRKKSQTRNYEWGNGRKNKGGKGKGFGGSINNLTKNTNPAPAHRISVPTQNLNDAARALSGLSSEISLNEWKESEKERIERMGKKKKNRASAKQRRKMRKMMRKIAQGEVNGEAIVSDSMNDIKRKNKHEWWMKKRDQRILKSREKRLQGEGDVGMSNDHINSDNGKME